MLTHADLRKLEQELRSAQVLSVYLDGRMNDPADRRQWRQTLRNALRDLNATLEEKDREIRDALAECVQRLDDVLPPEGTALGTVGWVGFVTRDGIHHAQGVPLPMPTMVRFAQGPWLSPYVRALKEDREVVIALADASGARLLSYRGGQLMPVAHIEGRQVDIEVNHMGEAPRDGFHPGVRGETGRDRAQRARNAAIEGMVSEIVGRLAPYAARETWMIVGGSPVVARMVEDALHERFGDRLTHIPSLRIDATDAEVAAMARQAGSMLTEALDLAVINRVADSLAFTGQGVMGRLATTRALEDLRVQQLYFTHRYLEAHSEEVENAVRSALRQGADLEEVSGEAAARLNDYGGIAATVRFTPALQASMP